LLHGLLQCLLLLWLPLRWLWPLLRPLLLLAVMSTHLPAVDRGEQGEQIRSELSGAM
jgi:hypothetical protein